MWSLTTVKYNNKIIFSEASVTSSNRDSEISVAGQVNRRLGQLLGYRDMTASQLTSCHQSLANITGYEIICNGDKQKYTVSLKTDFPLPYFLMRFG